MKQQPDLCPEVIIFEPAAGPIPGNQHVLTAL